MSQRANQQPRSHSKSSTGPAQGTVSSNAPRGAAKQARPSLVKKVSALFFGVGLNRRHPERERQAQARREALSSRAVKKTDTTPPWQLTCSLDVASSLLLWWV